MIPNKVTFRVSEWTSIFEEYYSKPSYFCTKQYSKNIFRYHLFLIITMRLGFPGGSVVNNLPANAGDTREMSLIPGLGRSPREGYGNPLQYSCLEDPTVRGAWWATVCGVAKSWTQLSDWAYMMLLQVMTFTDMSLVFGFQLNSWYLKSCLDFPDCPVVNNLPASAGDAEDVGSIPASGRSHGGGNGNPLQYSYLGKSHGQRVTVHRGRK